MKLSPQPRKPATGNPISYHHLLRQDWQRDYWCNHPNDTHCTHTCHVCHTYADGDAMYVPYGQKHAAKCIHVHWFIIAGRKALRVQSQGFHIFHTTFFANIKEGIQFTAQKAIAIKLWQTALISITALILSHSVIWWYLYSYTIFSWEKPQTFFLIQCLNYMMMPGKVHFRKSYS